MKNSKPVCRFAPSPTGFLHVGGARSALFNYLFARQHGGKLILRIEDTDLERSKPEYETDIIEGFKWLGLEFDETVRQSSRLASHTAKLKQLVEKGSAYVSKETQAEAGQRSEVIRFKNPNRKVVFEDLIKGRVEVDTTDLGDFVIAKSLQEPIFHFANVVDDAELGITHVIRGEEHLSNTPRQLLIWEAIGVSIPVYAHIPLILAPDRSKLSKRKHGEVVSLRYYRGLGFFPEAMLNYLSLLGWNPGDERELFSKEELVKEFKLERVQKGGAIFSREKLNWMNKEYLARLPIGEATLGIAAALAGAPPLSGLADWQRTRLAEALYERVQYFGEAKEVAERGELEYLLTPAGFGKAELVWKKAPDAEKTKTRLSNCVNLIEALGDRPSAEEVKAALFPYAEKEGKGEVLWPVRVSLSGKAQSIDPFNLIAILGKSESVSRMRRAIDLLQ